MLERYSRQMLFGPIGQAGQACLQAATILIVGCGALGTVLANHLCRAGIGHLVIADRDYIELHNLQRQILFDERDVEQHLPKAIAAAKHLRSVNSNVKIEALVEDIQADGIESLVREVDLVLDATDNFETRYLLNDVCVKYQRPWIYSGVMAAYGTTMNILPGETPCLRWVFPEMPLPGTTPTCDTAGVLNGIVGAIASIAATETLKILLKSEKISRALLWMDLWENTIERIELPRQPDCLCCGQQQYAFLTSLPRPNSTSLCGRNAVQVRGQTQGQLDLCALATRLQAVGKVQSNQFLLRLLIESDAEHYDITIFPDTRAIIKGTDDPQVARSIYARYIGL